MLVAVKNLQVYYGKHLALDIDREIRINEGERIGIIGSNGAGKSTFVKTILGLTDYKGQIITDLKPEEMAVHMQFNNYVSTMPVRYILEAILNTDIKENKKLRELIDFFEFEPCLRKRYKNLSGGQKQRLTIIMVMMQDAPLTFFDEVTSGLDFETRQKLMEKLCGWYQGRENTLCIVSHYYEELELLTDKLLMLDNGKVIDFGVKEELFRKYCGNSIIILDAVEQNRRLVEGCRKLCAPEHLIAVSCGDEQEEKRVSSFLIENDVNFKRSNNDIEIMSINAKETYYQRHGKGGKV